MTALIVIASVIVYFAISIAVRALYAKFRWGVETVQLRGGSEFKLYSDRHFYTVLWPIGLIVFALSMAYKWVDRVSSWNDVDDEE
jgi:hypothetical protein